MYRQTDLKKNQKTELRENYSTCCFLSLIRPLIISSFEPIPQLLVDDRENIMKLRVFNCFERFFRESNTVNWGKQE